MRHTTEAVTRMGYVLHVQCGLFTTNCRGIGENNFYGAYAWLYFVFNILIEIKRILDWLFDCQLKLIIILIKCHSPGNKSPECCRDESSACPPPIPPTPFPGAASGRSDRRRWSWPRPMPIPCLQLLPGSPNSPRPCLINFLESWKVDNK